MAKEEQKTGEHDAAAMQVAMNECLEALKPLNTEAQLRVLASVAVFLGIPDQLTRRLSR